MSFDIKKCLDAHVVPLLKGQGKIVSFIWRADLVLVFLEVETERWAGFVKRLLEDQGFTFDYLRGPERAAVNGVALVLFGGDGAPFIREDGRVMCRLHRKLGLDDDNDERGLVLEIMTPAMNAISSARVVKGFFAQWEGEPGSALLRHQPKLGGE